MKVLLVNDCPPGLEGSGGVETHVQQLHDALGSKGVETAILAHQYREKPECIEQNRAFIHELNAPPLRKHWIQNIRNRNTALNKAKAFIHAFNPDVIHIHNTMNPHTLSMLRSIAPVVKSIHDCRPFCTKPYPVVASRLIGNSDRFCDITFGTRCFTRCYAAAGTNINERLEAWASFPANLQALREITQTEHLIVYSQYLKTLAHRCMPHNAKLHVVHHFSAAEQVSANVPHETTTPFTFLFAGRLSSEKGILHIFDALQRLTDIRCRLLIAGDGPLRNTVRQCISERHGNHTIEMPGFLRQEELYALYNKADVLLFPSYGSEGCPLTGIEAMYFGTPAIGYDAGGVGEWLVNEQTGLLLPPKDIQGLAAAMRMMATDPEKTRVYGRQARAYVSKKFRRDQHIDALLDIYQQVLSSSSTNDRIRMS